MVAANLYLEINKLEVYNFTIGAQRWDTDFNMLLDKNSWVILAVDVYLSAEMLQ